MRKRIHKVANFLAFNLLFFALYLNFVYKDSSNAPPAVSTNQLVPAAAFSESLTDEKKTEKQPPADESTAPAGTIITSKVIH